ncbi:hypothetical protein ACFX1X_036782 [Malus domestica]
MDHVEDQYERFNGTHVDDRAKPYGRWFQNEVLEKNYIQPVGKGFGLDPEGGWVMSVLPTEDLDGLMDDETDEVLARGEMGQIGTLLPDLNVTHNDHGSVDDRALLPYLPQKVREA